MVSVGVTLSVSDNAARSFVTCASEPVIVTLVEPDPVTVPALPTVSRPCVSASVTVNVSPATLFASLRLTPPIAVAVPSATVAATKTIFATESDSREMQPYITACAKYGIISKSFDAAELYARI